ncbi:MAG: hypothetical protein HYS05_09510 [Acidobacteria bacterium]|nr:hypothetical protein [Acidobacteriota bacterium]
MSSLRTVSAALLAGAMGLFPILPPEHAHDSEDRAGRHHVMVHRHANLHGLQAEHHGGASLDDTNPIATLEPVFTAPGPVSFPAPHFAVQALLEPAIIGRRPVHQAFDQQPIHGPPRAPAALRAPPRLSA